MKESLFKLVRLIFGHQKISSDFEKNIKVAVHKKIEIKAAIMKSPFYIISIRTPTFSIH